MLKLISLNNLLTVLLIDGTLIFSSRFATFLYSFGYFVSINSIIFSDMCSIGLHVMQSILIGCPQSQISFFPSFSITFQRFLFVVYNFVSSRSSPFWASHFTAHNLKVLMNHFTYSDPSSFLQRNRKWCNVSLCYLYNLHL